MSGSGPRCAPLFRAYQNTISDGNTFQPEQRRATTVSSAPEILTPILEATATQKDEMWASLFEWARSRKKANPSSAFTAVSAGDELASDLTGLNVAADEDSVGRGDDFGGEDVSMSMVEDEPQPGSAEGELGAATTVREDKDGGGHFEEPARRALLR